MTAVPQTARAEASGFARFCIVGAFGFLIDAGLLLWFTGPLGLNPFVARALSICLAVTMTWAMHRQWTFRTSGERRLSEWARFVAVNGVGGAFNYVVYSAVLIIQPGTTPLTALVIGSAAALCVNYLGARLWAYGRSRHPVRR